METVKSYKRLLSNQTIKGLKNLIGCNIYQLFSPIISIESDESIIADSFSFSDKKNWYNFSNKWKETDNDFTFHEFKLEISDTPLNIKYEKESRSLYNPCSVALPTSKAKISRIEIYTLDDTAETDQEEVIYDYAVLFIYENGYRFCISVYEESIADELQLIRNNTDIQNRLKETMLRVTL